MSNHFLSIEDIRAVVQSHFGITRDEFSYFMGWLHRQPQLRIGSGDHDYEITSQQSCCDWYDLFCRRPVKLGNAFSFNMLNVPQGDIRFREIDAETVSAMADIRPIYSAVGHVDTARLLSRETGLELEPNRETVALYPGDDFIVAQYSGPRLPEGSVVLPEGASIRWLLVEVR